MATAGTTSSNATAVWAGNRFLHARSLLTQTVTGSGPWEILDDTTANPAIADSTVYTGTLTVSAPNAATAVSEDSLQLIRRLPGE